MPTEGHRTNQTPDDAAVEGIFPPTIDRFPPEFKGLLLDPITRGLKRKRATGITGSADPFHLSQHSSRDEVEARGGERRGKGETGRWHSLDSQYVSGESEVRPDGTGLPVFGNHSIRRRDARQKVVGNVAGVSS